MLHAVVLTTPAGSSLDDAARNRAFVLDRGPRDSGGTRTDVLASQAFEGKLKELAAILKSQHRVVYARPQTLIPPQKIEVDVRQSRRRRERRPGPRTGGQVDARTLLPGRALVAGGRARLSGVSRRPQATAPAPQAPKAPQAPQEKPQVFRAGIEVVSLNVTVTDAQGRYVTDLAQDEFSVFEDGAKQELTYFNRTNLPIALSLLIDSSASMEQRMENAQEAAIGFAKKLRPQDLAQVVDFDSRVEIKLGFTNKVDELEAAIHAHLGGRIDGAAQRRLHLAEGAREDQGEEPRRDPPPGDRRAVGRRRHVEPGHASRKCWSWRSDRRRRSTRSACSRARPARSRDSAKPSSCCASSRRKPAAARSSPSRSTS